MFLKLLISVLVALFLSQLFFIYYAIPFCLFFIMILFWLTFIWPKKVLIIASALFPFINIITFRIFSVDIRSIEFVFLFCCFVFTVNALSRGRGVIQLRASAADKWFVGVLVLVGAGVFYSGFPHIVLRESVQLVYFYLLFRVLSCVLQEEQSQKLFFNVLLVGTVVFCIFGFLAVSLGRFPIPRLYIFNGFPQLLFTDIAKQMTEGGGLSILRVSIFFWGAVGTAVVLIILYYFIAAYKRFYFKGLLLFLIFILIVLTGSRAGLVTFFILFFIESLLSRKAIVIKLLMGLLLIGILLTIPQIRERTKEAFSTREGSSRSHFATWLSCVDMFKSSPVFGVGIGCFAERIDDFNRFNRFDVYYKRGDSVAPHNLILQILAENGLLGLILIIGMLLCIIAPIITTIKSGGGVLLVNVFLAFFGVLLMNMTMNGFYNEYFWISLGVLVGIHDSLKHASRRMVSS